MTHFQSQFKVESSFSHWLKVHGSGLNLIKILASISNQPAVDSHLISVIHIFFKFLQLFLSSTTQHHTAFCSKLKLTTMVFHQFSAANFLCLGLEFAGFDELWQHKTNGKTNLKCFQASYYASPKTSADFLLIYRQQRFQKL
jgi:hypothetical protein